VSEKTQLGNSSQSRLAPHFHNKRRLLRNPSPTQITLSKAPRTASTVLGLRTPSSSGSTLNSLDTIPWSSGISIIFSRPLPTLLRISPAQFRLKFREDLYKRGDYNILSRGGHAIIYSEKVSSCFLCYKDICNEHVK